MKISPVALQAFCETALRKAGLSPDDAAAAGEILVTTDSWGVFTHGTKSLRGYIRRLRAGGLRARAVPKIVAEGPAWALVDADSGLGMVAARFAMERAIAKASEAGMAYVGLRNGCHFGAAGYYAALAAKAGQIGLAMANDIPTVTAPGARGPVLGSNPFAFACPTGTDHPVLLDMATSTVAGGKVFAAAALGQSIPSHWIVDADGRPTTDPRRFPEEGALTPMAGHKGYGLALLIEILSAVLTGAAITRQVVSWMYGPPELPTGHGAAFIAVHISALMPLPDFQRRMAALIAEIRSAPKAQGTERIYLPGEMEWERRERAMAEGIDLPEDVVASLRALAEDFALEEPRFQK